MTNHTKIFNGIYNLDKRMKEIDPNYRFVYDCKTGEFILQSKRGLNYQNELSFGRVADPRAAVKARKTRRENIAKLIKMIDENNEKLEENAFLSNLDKSRQIARELIFYADRSGRDLSEKDIEKIING